MLGPGRKTTRCWARVQTSESSVYEKRILQQQHLNDECFFCFCFLCPKFAQNQFQATFHGKMTNVMFFVEVNMYVAL